MPAFRHKVLHILRDAQENFEQLERESPTELQRLGSSTVVGAWTNPESFSTKTELHTTLQVRTEQGGAVARLKGTFKAKEAIPATTALFTLPVGFRPSEARREWASNATKATVLLIAIASTGVVTTEGAEVGAGDLVHVDGITINLT